MAPRGMVGSSQTLHNQVKRTLHGWLDRVSGIKCRVNVSTFYNISTTIDTLQLLTNAPKHIAMFLLWTVKYDVGV